MKLKLLFGLALSLLLAWNTHSQNVVLFDENFESGGGSFILNGAGVGSNSGSNMWIVNNNYTGGPGVPNTINEDSTYGGTISFAPFGHYLHIYDQPSGITDCAYNPLNISDRFAYTWNNICTLDAYNCSLNFFYMGVGSANAYGTVYYSRNNGPWTQCGAAQYNSKYKWQYATITNPGFDNCYNLRIGFRWQNNSAAGSDTSSLGIDDVTVAGTYDTVTHPVHITCTVTPDTICAGGGGSVNLSFTTSDTLCYASYSIYMSDSNGNFSNIQLAWTTSMGYPFVTAGPFGLSIPGNIPPGHCYKFRVDRISDPAVIGLETGCIVIENCPHVITTMQPSVTLDTLHPVCAGSVIQVPFTSTGVYGNTNVYYAELSDSAGNFTTYDTIASLVSNTAYPSPLQPGVASGQIPFTVKASCHYYIRIVSDTPHVIGATYGPFCIQHCDIWTDTATTSLQACIKSCYRDPGGFNIKVPYKIHKYDTNQQYNSGNKFEAQLLSTLNLAIKATGSPFGVYVDTTTGTMTIHVPCGDSLCNILPQPSTGTYFLRIISTNTNQSDSEYGTLIFLNIGYPQDSSVILTFPQTSVFCDGAVPVFYAFTPSSCTNNWGGGSVYDWYWNNILYPPPFNQPSIGITMSGSGPATLMVREINNGCKGPLDTLKLKIEGLPQDNISCPVKICDGDTNKYSVPFTNNTYYKWKPKGTKTIDTANNVLKVVYDTAGTFNIEIVAIDSCGADSNTRRITVVAKPKITIAPIPPVCAGTPVTLTASATGNNNNFRWTPNIDLSCTKCATTIASPPVGTQQYIVIDSNGTCKARDTVKVVVNPVPTDNVCCYSVINAGASVQLFVQPGSGNETYSWVPPNSLDNPAKQNPTATPTVTTTYTVTITDTIGGCSRLDTVTVVVNEQCGSVWVPDAFSPNGDLQNDVLYVRGGCIQSVDFIVYDRWGNKVFETQDQSVGWDGTYGGKPMNTGTYVYYLTALLKGNNGVLSTVSRKGNVTLVR